MEREFGPLLQKKNLKKIGNYGLNLELNEKLKMKLEYYTYNKDIVDEKLEDLKEEMNKMRDDIVKYTDGLNERREDLFLIENKNGALEKDSYSFKKGAILVRESSKAKKICLPIIILGILASIAIIIILIVC